MSETPDHTTSSATAATTDQDNRQPSLTDLQAQISTYIDSIKEDLWLLNQQIHSNPETAFQEHKTHDAVVAFLEDHGHKVTRHAYGLDTAFEARSGTVAAAGTGRLVNFNAELDALPAPLGHACGHNLICVSSVAAYLGLSSVLDQKQPPKPGAANAAAGWQLEGKRAQLLGTPAEEEGGGKVVLLEAGAYDGVDVSLMAHPAADYEYQYLGGSYIGIATQPTLSIGDLRVTYTGRPAHAAANPWDGRNALDAVVASYNNISLLRQQMRPDERVHGAILETPHITNAIPAHTRVKWTVRAPTLTQLLPLLARVRACVDAAALATGCDVTVDEPTPDRYADIRPNSTLGAAFAAPFTQFDPAGGAVALLQNPKPLSASTDMGNVTHALPGLHPMVGIPTGIDKTAFPHNAGFERAAGSRDAFERFVAVAKALAVVGAKVWLDDGFVDEVKREFAALAKG